MHHQLHLKKPLAFFDLETTGTNTIKDRIIEICVMKAMPGGEVQTRTHRLNPEMPIPLESSLIHGIYDADVAEAPTFKKVARTLAQFMEGCDLAGFNSNRFDVPVLVEEFLRANVDFDLKNRKLIDVQRLFHLMEPRTLTAAYRFYCDKELIGAHGAEMDTQATLEVFEAQLKRYVGQMAKAENGQELAFEPTIDMVNSLTINNNVDLAGRFVFNEHGEEVMNFGKNKGTPVRDVLKNEPAFYDWMIKSEFPLDTKRKLTEIKLRMFMPQSR